MSDGEVLETAHDGNVRLVLHVDEHPENPREEYDHLCHVATVPDTRYIDVDPDAGPYAHAWRYFEHSPRLFVRYVRMLHGVAEYRTPHDGVPAVWYLTRQDIDRESTPAPDWAVSYIKAEANEYEAWARGDVYGYVIEQRSDWQRTLHDGTDETQEAWETLESCFGFYGYDYAVEEARDAWSAHIEQAPATAQ